MSSSPMKQRMKKTKTLLPANSTETDNSDDRPSQPDIMIVADLVESTSSSSSAAAKPKVEYDPKRAKARQALADVIHEDIKESLEEADEIQKEASKRVIGSTAAIDKKIKELMNIKPDNQRWEKRITPMELEKIDEEIEKLIMGDDFDEDEQR